MPTLISQALELWLHGPAGLAIRWLLPTVDTMVPLVVAVLALQHLLLAGLVAASWRGLRARPQSSSPAASSGNSTSVKPNWLKSRTRIG